MRKMDNPHPATTYVTVTEKVRACVRGGGKRVHLHCACWLAACLKHCNDACTHHNTCQVGKEKSREAILDYRSKFKVSCMRACPGQQGDA